MTLGNANAKVAYSRPSLMRIEVIVTNLYIDEAEVGKSRTTDLCRYHSSLE